MVRKKRIEENHRETGTQKIREVCCRKTRSQNERMKERSLVKKKNEEELRVNVKGRRGES